MILFTHVSVPHREESNKGFNHILRAQYPAFYNCCWPDPAFLGMEFVLNDGAIAEKKKWEEGFARLVSAVTSALKNVHVCKCVCVKSGRWNLIRVLTLLLFLRTKRVLPEQQAK